MAIFPNSVRDIDHIIVSYIGDPLTALSLSAVNKNANEVIANDLFFKQYFTEQFSTFGESFLKQMSLCFPDISWKVACCACSHGIIPNRTFIRTRIEEIPSQLITTKALLEKEKLEICGSRYEDPNSKICQAHKAASVAYEAHEAYLAEIEDVMMGGASEKIPELVEISAILRKDHNSNDIKMLRNVLMDHDIYEILLKVPEELSPYEREIKKTAFNESASEFSPFGSEFYMREHLIPQYISLGNIFCKNKFADECNYKCHEYEALEEKRIDLNNSISDIDRLFCQINDSLGNEEKTERFISNLYDSAVFDKNQTVKSNCISIIQRFINDNSEKSPERIDLERIRMLINSHSKSGIIWGELYERCANDVQEEAWAENHFHEFLQELSEVLESSELLISCGFNKVMHADVNCELECIDFIMYALSGIKYYATYPIQSLINSHSKCYIIWGELYRKCGEDVQEDAWAENHFQWHLRELQDILVKLHSSRHLGLIKEFNRKHPAPDKCHEGIMTRDRRRRGPGRGIGDLHLQHGHVGTRPR